MLKIFELPGISSEQALALEEQATGQAQKETEYVYYARLADVSILDQAVEVEAHEQWEIRINKTAFNAASGRMRIRKTAWPKDESKAAEYVLTTKTKRSEGGETEVSIPTTEDGFEQFKLFSERGMIKTRYKLAIAGRQACWEIDLYKDPHGNLSPWCKIDYELVEGENIEPPNLPDGFIDIITPFNRTPEQDAMVSDLYDKIFITPNVHVKPAVKQAIKQNPEAPAVQELSQ